jgi:lipoprotein-anchoring transpeptidase ErfK/SrfK
MGAPTAQQVRPRYGRIAVAATSVTVTACAVLGGVGVLPSAAEGPDRTAKIEAVVETRHAPETAELRAEAGFLPTSPTAAEPAVPPGSGKGRRVVFSEGQQRVWLVEAGGDVLRTYLVSGSVYDNLDPGTYSVYSRSEQAWGIEDSGTMKYFVRFAHGDNASIGFHDIPVDDGRPVQTVDELGTPLSHGCIRQRRSDAKQLWEFAPLGTRVVVTA